MPIHRNVIDIIAGGTTVRPSQVGIGIWHIFKDETTLVAVAKGADLDASGKAVETIFSKEEIPFPSGSSKVVFEYKMASVPAGKTFPEYACEVLGGTGTTLYKYKVTTESQGSQTC